MTGNTSSTSLQLTIRLSSSSRFVIGSCGTITSTSTIRQVKDIIALREESGNCAVERQRLIHKGRILSDDGRSLADYGITGADASGETVLYLVKGGGSGNGNAGVGGAGATMTNGSTSSTPATSTSLPPPAAPTNPFLNFGNPNANAADTANNPMANIMNMMGNMGGLGSDGLGGAGMPDMASIQQQLQQNPQMMSDMMNNPMVQSLMGSPDFLRTMMESNPQMRAVMESNPELRQALEDPEFMRRSMQMMRDPSAMQNMMRGQDLAMANIENMPGGFNALRRMYEDVQEPMMDALGGSASTTTGNGSGDTGHSRAAGAANQAMPNPWGAPSSSSTSTNPAGGGAANPFASMMGGMGAGGGGANPFASLMGGMPGAGGAGAANNPWANPMMGPNGQNLESTLQMLENPMMQQMMQQMMSNPDNMRQMMQSNPMLQQMAQTNPQAAAMFENPEMVRS